MAERRMFARRIVNSSRFLKMPPTSRLLYYDLGVDADDDGVVEAYTTMLKDGATEDDLKVLCSKGFITILNEDLVVYINDWKANNYIQKDRYTPSYYAHLLKSMDTQCIQPVSKVDTQGRLDENRLDKSIYRVGGNNDVDDDTNQPTNYRPPTLEQVCEYVKERGDKIDAEKFYDVYSANKWLTKRGTPVLDWKSAVRAWERTEYPDKKQSNNIANPSFETDSYFEAALVRSYGEDHVKTIRENK